MSAESLKLWCEIVALIAVGISVVVGGFALFLGNRLNTAQREKLLLFDKELTDAKTELGKQEVRAANAERDMADAKKAASDADANVEGLRKEVATANERAAEANKAAEQERLARLRIEDKLAGWKLDGKAQARIIAAVRKYENTPFDLGVNPNEFAFMETIDSVLIAAGWTRQIPKPDNPLLNILLAGKARINYISGIHVEIALSRRDDLGPAAAALVLALKAEGIPVPNDVQLAPTEPDPTAIHLVIGCK